MSENEAVQDRYSPAFQSLASIVNQQPPETREEMRTAFGEYLHDIKHTIGLITGAAAILQRDLDSGCEDFDSPEMVAIITDAALRINQYINLLNEALVTQIDAEVTG